MSGTSIQLDLVRWIRQCLQSPICLEGAALEFFEATFGHRDPAMLTDLESGEAASLLELLFYPDEQVRLQFEACWGERSYSHMQAEALADELIKEPMTAALTLDTAASAMSLRVPDYAVKAFIERLRLSWQPPARLHDIIKGALQQQHLVQVRARLRHSRVDWNAGRLLFLEQFLSRIPVAADDFVSCLDFLLGIVSELGPAQSPFDFLIAKKLSFFQALCRNESIARRLRGGTMETIMLQGTRVVLGNIEQWETGMRLVDRICTALYGRTQIFQRPEDSCRQVRCAAPDRNMEAFWREYD